MDHVNPYAAPQFDAHPSYTPVFAHDVWRDGAMLVMDRKGVLPNRCVKCNEAANGYRLKRYLSWHHPAWFLLALCSILLYVIAALIVRHTARIEVGLCQRHRSARFTSILIAWGIIAAAVGMIVVILTVYEDANPDVVPLGITGSIGLLFVGIIFGLVRARTVWPKQIDKQHIWLKGVCPAYLDELPDFGSRFESSAAGYAVAIDNPAAPPAQRAAALFNRALSHLFENRRAQAQADLAAVLAIPDAPPSLRAKAQEKLREILE